MKTSTFSIIAVLGTAVGIAFAQTQCDMSAIEGSLLANGTTWHDSCTAATGFDVFMLSSLPTTSQAKQISQNRDCVNYLNQLNQQANSGIQCTTQVGDQTVNLGELLTDFLTGKTGNKTKVATVGSDSASGSVEISLSGSDSESGSASSSESESTSGSTTSKKKKSMSSESSSGSADNLSDGSSSKKASGATTTAFSAMKTSFVIALALVNAAAYASATDCDMSKIESLLYPNATEGLANCENATGIDIFAVNEFPTTEQVTQLSQNVDCADYFNQINQVANSEIQCNVTIQGVPMNFGTLIADFLTGKTGNESDSGSGSIELPSGSDSGSEAAGSAKLDSSATSSGSTAKSASSSNAAAGAASALSLVTYSVAAAIAFALH
ncbi:hypothetical protein JM18_001436 [Phytophthora kernoviae]|uniref:Elicitin-like protein n=2 Tax=Phytophthora kernoviae TaxID=325452 RepID=A0A922ASG3_9STRA|nr:hypothetical protein G195_002571 [Phytophthora kernoviae 00238/432]KAG2532056.1 hypothetical protein JM18_001436 [Phytophthora kernoviae]